MPSESRACAHAVLRRVFEDGAYADRAFHSCARSLSPRDRALAMRLAYGAIQRASTLDHVAERLTGRSAGRLDGTVLTALRVGLYELLLCRAAPYAVVDDAVELVKQSGSRGHGLVNATLRRATREGASILAELGDGTAAEAAIAHSHPRWLAEMWWSELGAERARALMAACNEPAETSVRANTLVAGTRAGAEDAVGELTSDAATSTIAARLESRARGEADGGEPALRVRRGAPLLGVVLPEALVLDGRVDLLASPEWRDGELIAQSRAAMLVARVLAPAPGQRVLDLCAAPGGKSTHLAALMGGRGEVLAIERDPARAATLRETVRRLRARSVTVVEADAEALPDELATGGFDHVLLDPPCSGLGTLQAHPDLRWRMSERRIAPLAALQARMLASAARAVSAGGTLVYSTCTISQAENERQIEAFLQSHPHFVAERLSPDAPFLATLPSEDGTAGFFIAKLRRS
ncbi:MAG: 16S rRNA (cytosine(967)-C(5))-methyltransferase RsmB [Solirubrobacteraceae bacterium]